MYFLKKNKCKFLHHLHITTVTENHSQLHPEASGLPCDLLGHESKGKSNDHLCELTLKPLISVLHCLNHHPQCYQSPDTISQLPACTQGYKSIPKASKTPQKYFHYANVAPAPSLFNKSRSGSMQKLF